MEMILLVIHKVGSFMLLPLQSCPTLGFFQIKVCRYNGLPVAMVPILYYTPRLITLS